MSTPWEPDQSPQPAPKRKRRPGVLGWIGIIVGAFVVIGIIGAIAGGGGSTGKTTATDAPASGGHKTSGAPAAKPRTKAWRNVLQTSGSASKRSPLFAMHGGQARLRYTLTDPGHTGAATAAIYVLKDGVELERDGGFPVVTATEPGSDTTELAPGDGQFYLLVNAANTHWSVTIQEYR